MSINEEYFEKYSKESIHPYGTSPCLLIEKMVREYSKNVQSFSLCDMGCGDGAVLYALNYKGLLKKAINVVGVDLSPIRIERIKQLNISQLSGIVSDVCSVKQLLNESFDLIICSQVIEHVPNDKILMEEIYRILKIGGKAYIGTVIRKKPGIWVYRNNGQLVLDPTHVHEYSSENELFSLFNNKFIICDSLIVPVKYYLYDVIVRVLVKLKIISTIKANILLSRQLIIRDAEMNRQNFIKNIQIPIYGFFIAKVIIEKI